jgi:DNA-binding MarR family transcriptional regulator
VHLHSAPLGRTVSRSELLDEDGSDASFRAMLVELSILQDNVAAARAHLATLLDVSVRQYTIFMAVAERQGRQDVTVSFLANLLRISGPFITSETGALVRRGFLEKVPNPNDGRSSLVRLSEQGTALLNRFRPVLVEINDAMFASLNHTDFAAFRRIVGELAATTSRIAHGLAAP